MVTLLTNIYTSKHHCNPVQRPYTRAEARACQRPEACQSEISEDITHLSWHKKPYYLHQLCFFTHPFIINRCVGARQPDKRFACLLYRRESSNAETGHTEPAFVRKPSTLPGFSTVFLRKPACYQIFLRTHNHCNGSHPSLPLIHVVCRAFLHGIAVTSTCATSSQYQNILMQSEVQVQLQGAPSRTRARLHPAPQPPILAGATRICPQRRTAHYHCFS